MVKKLMILAIITFVAFGSLWLTACDRGINKSKAKLLLDEENATQTVFFREQRSGVQMFFRANYDGADSLFYAVYQNEARNTNLSDRYNGNNFWKVAKRLIDKNASDISFPNIRITDDALKSNLLEYNNNILCYQENSRYYGVNENKGWEVQFGEPYEIASNELTDYYQGKEENLDLINPSYEALNYGTFQKKINEEVQEFFYFMTIRDVYIYSVETLQLVEQITTTDDIFGAVYSLNGYGSKDEKGDSNEFDGKFLIAIKDDKLFKIVEYPI